MQGLRVHHLNCGSMRSGSNELVCHVLLVETDRGPVLVDSGYGLADVADPRRLGPFRFASNPRLDPAETAARQIEALGFTREDVRDIVLTHFDMDHMGGIVDFPHARVHVTAEEEDAIRNPGLVERLRYRSAQWAHGPQLAAHGAEGESWRGFPTARQLTEVDERIVLVPLPGHSRGHAGVAVDTGDGWLLHAGDAFYHHSVLTGRDRTPLRIRLLEQSLTRDPSRVAENHRRLAALHREGAGDVRVFCAHDATQFAEHSGGLSPGRRG